MIVSFLCFFISLTFVILTILSFKVTVTIVYRLYLKRKDPQRFEALANERYGVDLTWHHLFSAILLLVLMIAGIIAFAAFI